MALLLQGLEAFIHGRLKVRGQGASGDEPPDACRKIVKSVQSILVGRLDAAIDLALKVVEFQKSAISFRGNHKPARDAKMQPVLYFSQRGCL